MSRMEARRRRKGAFFRKNRLTLIAVGIGVLIVGLVVGWIVSASNPYRSILRKADVDVEKVQVKQDVVTLTFEGDSVGILSCRSALNALRAKNPPKTVNYRLVKDGEPILSGTVSHVGVKQPNASPRVETLDREMTLLKLKYELAQSGISAETEAYQTVGISGKTIRVTVQTTPQALQSVVTSLPAALESVNEQGGGIVRCDVLFTEAEGVFAAVSYDLVYGDTLYSSAFSQD